MTESASNSLLATVGPYLQLARIDHWFKNVFMLFGAMMAVFFDLSVVNWALVPRLLVAFLACSLVASSNYVLNELIDAPRDRLHPSKKNRPFPQGLVRANLAIAMWLLLAAAGIGLAATVSYTVAMVAGLFWCLALLYNVPPIAAKSRPFLDVIVESANNPVRLFLGWFTVNTSIFPPLSLVLSYWMAGAFFMASKRLAEFRHIGNAETAAAYRSSFAFYNDNRLLTSSLFYATSCALFSGIFIVRHRVELVLLVPVVAGFFAYYFSIALKPNSAVQYPERLYRERLLMWYLGVSIALFFVLMIVPIPWLYLVFDIPRETALWNVP